MKKFLVFVAIAGVVVGWWYIKDASDRKSAAASPQAEAVTVVETFMGTVSKLGGLIYEEKQREKLKADVAKLEEKGEEATKEEVQDIFEKHGLESTAYLFKDEKDAKATTAILLMFRFDSFTVESNNVTEGIATISARFVPLDVMGIKALTKAMGVKQAEQQESKPVVVVFHLEKQRYRWHIKSLSGELSDAIKAARKF